jgi:Sarcosine oxidase, delta subunit family
MSDSSNNAGPWCPYDGDSNIRELGDMGKTAERDSKSPVSLEWWCHTMGCGNWFLVISNPNSGKILGIVRNPKDWEQPSP